MSYVNPVLAKLALKKVPKKIIMGALDQHYCVMRELIMGVTKDRWHLLLNGDAGMGKTEYTNELIAQYMKKSKILCGHISGTLSAVDLYVRLYKHRKQGQVLIIDDTDRILEQTESLEVLKSALDTSKDKKIDWGKAYSSHLKRQNCPAEFTYSGRVIIITNKMIQTAPDKNPTISQARLLPFLSRVNYFRAGLPGNNWKIFALRMFADNWESKIDKKLKYELRCAEDIVIQKSDAITSSGKKGKVKQNLKVLSDKKQKFSKGDIKRKIIHEIIDWIEDHADDMQEISFRTIAQIIELRNEYPENWKYLAESTKTS